MPERGIVSRTLLNFFLVYRCLLHSQSCDRPRSIFTSISFSLRRLTIWGQEVLLRTVHFPYQYYTRLWTVQYCGHVLRLTAQQLLQTAAQYRYL